MQVEIREAELQRIRRKPTRDLSAYDAFLRAAIPLLPDSLAKTTRRRVASPSAQSSWTRATRRPMPCSAAPTACRVRPWGGTWTRACWTAPRSWHGGRSKLDPVRRPRLYNSRRGEYLFRGRSEEAVAAAERAIELAPSWDAPHFLLATALDLQGRFLAAGSGDESRHAPQPAASGGVSGGWWAG